LPQQQDPNARRLPLEMRRGNSPPRRLKGGNKRSTVEALQLRWKMLIPV